MKGRTAPPTMPFMLGLLMLFAIFAGCLGGDDGGDSYSGPIDIVLIQSAVGGTVSLTKSGGNNTVQNDTFTVTFDLSGTTSGDGDIVSFTLDPGDGSTPIVTDASEDSVIEHDYWSHGVFEVSITAGDTAGNKRTIYSMVHINFEQRYNDQGTDEPDVVWLDAIGPSLNTPLWINLTSIVENIQGNNFPFVGDTRPVDVTWKIYDSSNTVINETTETIADGESMEFITNTEIPADVRWRLEITLNDDVTVNADSTFSVFYPVHQ